ncbi:hypothetical protein JCM8547_002562 [Rhodosporidiobolus lusitaniae]
MPLKHLPRFALTIAWITASAVQYGYGIAELNSVSSSLMCTGTSPEQRGALGLPSCVPLTDSQFGTVTSAYVVGGLVSSLSAGSMVERWGKTGTAVRAAVVVILGALAVSLGSSLVILVVGRILIGIACGIATVLVPLYLRSVAPPAIAGSVGILTQISTNVGIFVAQGVSLPLSKAGTGQWRFVPLVSVGLALLQILTAPLMPEAGPKDSTSRIFDTSDGEDEERAPLAREEDPDAPRRKSDDDIPSFSVWEVLRSKDEAVRRPLYTLILVMLFQQLSGINAVMFYSTSILTAVNPASAKTVSLLVTLVNLIMTFPAIYLVDRLGRRTLLFLSLLIMTVSTAVLGWSINTSHFYIASAFIMFFVVGFATGLGPVPFVLVGEMPPEEAKSATASIAVATNWIANLAVGVGFLPLRDFLTSRSSGGSGTVFYVFTAFTALGTIVLARLLR